jgi:GNAT superfamily N-acetyltransferase
VVSPSLERLRFGEAALEGTTTRVFVAYIPMAGGILPVGALSVDREHDSLELVFVQKSFRRQGVARRLLEVAKSSVGRELTDTGLRSEAGGQWADAVGLLRGGRKKELETKEAEARGNGLMVPLYGAEIQELQEAASQEVPSP